MSLRLRLFLLMGGLVALLVAAQWWWVRLLTTELSSEIDVVVAAVGESMAAAFEDPDFGAHEKVIDCDGEDCEDRQIRRIVRLERGGETHTEADGKVLVKKLERVEPGGENPGGGEPAGHYGFAVQFGHPEDAGETATGDEDRIARHVKLHIEHQDGARFLLLGTPDMGRRIQIPLAGYRDKLERFSRRTVFGSLGFLALGLVLAGVVAHRVTTPLRQLAGAARLLGAGALGTRVPARAEGEVGEALQAFNRMSGQLEELDARARTLEAHKHLGEIGEIARGLAHTLRNPLNALGLSVEELAAQSAASQAAPELADAARRQIRRIDQSIRSFLALASQSGGVLTEVDLGELLEDVGLEALQDGRGRVRLEIEAEAADGLLRLRGVEPELRAVLQALVVNAVEASPEGGRVSVKATPAAAGRIRVEIEDEGPGLAPEVRQRLFTPHLSTKANGSGMGLFLAHRIATNRYGGHLELIDRHGVDSHGVDRQTGGTRAVLELGERERSLSDGNGHE